MGMGRRREWRQHLEVRARGPRSREVKEVKSSPAERSQEARVEEGYLEVGCPRREEGVSRRTKWPAVSTAARD